MIKPISTVPANQISNLYKNALRSSSQYLGPGHVFSAQEIADAAKLVSKKSVQAQPVDYFNPRALVKVVDDKAAVGSKLDVYEGHMFG